MFFFKGRLFVIRLFVIEWFMYLDWKVDLSDELFLFVGFMYDFLVYTVYEFFMSKEDMYEWIKKVGLDMKNNF